MSELVEGLRLMLIGMAVVFTFLILLILYMKFVPILSQSRSSQNNMDTSEVDRTGNISEQAAKPELNFTEMSEQKLKLNSMLNNLSDQSSIIGTEDGRLAEPTVAAIAAAVYSITGEKPRQLVITTTGGKVESYNLWGVAGRQDIMQGRDVTGQVGFQY